MISKRAINLLFCFDSKSTEHFASQMLQLLCLHNRKLNFHIITADKDYKVVSSAVHKLYDNALRLLNKKCNFSVSIYSISDVLAKIGYTNNSIIPISSYYLYTPKFFANISKMLYASTDVLFLHSLDVLFDDVNIKPFTVAAVEDYSSSMHQLKFKAFASSMMLMNLTKMRKTSQSKWFKLDNIYWLPKVWQDSQTSKWLKGEYPNVNEPYALCFADSHKPWNTSKAYDMTYINKFMAYSTALCSSNISTAKYLEELNHTKRSNNENTRLLQVR